MPCTGISSETGNCQSKLKQQYFSWGIVQSQDIYIFLVEGTWTTWDNWGACSGTCNTNTRTRSMLYSGNIPCTGTSSEIGACQGEYENTELKDMKVQDDK